VARHEEIQFRVELEDLRVFLEDLQGLPAQGRAVVVEANFLEALGARELGPAEAGLRDLDAGRQAGRGGGLLLFLSSRGLGRGGRFLSGRSGLPDLGPGAGGQRGKGRARG